MDREGNILSNLPIPYLKYDIHNPDNGTHVHKYSHFLDLYLGNYNYIINDRNYYGVVSTNESGSVYNKVTGDGYIDLNPIFGYENRYIYFERKRDMLVDPDRNNWILKIDLHDNSIQTFLPKGAFGGARNIYLVDFSDKIILL